MALTVPQSRSSPGNGNKKAGLSADEPRDSNTPRDQDPAGSRSLGTLAGPGKVTTSGSAWERLKANEKVHLAWCVFGVVGCLMLYGVLQERIMVEPFKTGDVEERFRYSLFLVMCNRLTSCVIAITMLVSHGKYQELKPVAPWYNYAFVSVSNVVATFCQYEALKYVSFPVQTLGKCAKMLPVMVWGIIIMRKRYTVKDFGLALCITGGCTLFLLTGDIKSKAHLEAGMGFALWGLALMVGYLGFDGFTSTWQDKLFKGYQMTTFNQILYTTIFSSIFSLISMKAKGNEDVLAVQFLQRHPDALWQIIALSASASIGSLFISYTIKSFGALIFATIMTTRQFLSILLSCFLFMHPLSLGQWAGSVVVFTALYYQGFSKKEKPSKGSAADTTDKPGKTNGDEESQVPLLKAAAPADNLGPGGAVDDLLDGKQAQLR